MVPIKKQSIYDFRVFMSEMLEYKLDNTLY